MPAASNRVPIKTIVLAGLTLLVASGCAAMRSGPEKTQLETREFQTRTFEAADSKLVMKALLNVLQDEGYIVRSADSDLGFLTASREDNVRRGFWQVALGKKADRWEATRITEVTANVNPQGKNARVRANFRGKSVDNMGATLRSWQIDDENFYQRFFIKVDKGVFLQKEEL